MSDGTIASLRSTYSPVETVRRPLIAASNGKSALCTLCTLENTKKTPQAPTCFADCEPDGDVDLDDYVCFFACALGPGQGLLPDCEPFDLDDDGDVDIVDYSRFETQFRGPS